MLKRARLTHKLSTLNPAKRNVPDSKASRYEKALL